MTTVEVKSSWQSIFEWILRSDKLRSYINTYFTKEANIHSLYNLYLNEYEKDLKKSGKKIIGKISEEERRSSGKSELSFGSPQKKPKTMEEFVKYLYVNIGKYEKTQKYVLNELHKIRHDNGNNILHMMASVNATDVHPYMVLDKYHGNNLWLQTNNNNEIPLHLLFQHREISQLVFKFAVDNSIQGFGIQNKQGNNVLHVFFMKHSNQIFQKYILDKYTYGLIPAEHLNTPNSMGETVITIYNRLMRWYINNETRRLNNPQHFQPFQFDLYQTTAPRAAPSRASAANVAAPIQAKPIYIHNKPILEKTETLADLLVSIKETVKRARDVASKSSSSDDSQKQKSKKPRGDKK